MSNGDQLRRIATRVHSDLKEASNRASHEASSMARWIIATLTIVNGAAAVAILGIENVEPLSALLATALFATGVMLALGSGYASVRNFQKRMSKSLGELTGYWAAVSEGAPHDEAKASELQRAMNASLDPKWVARLSGTSAVAFVLGCLSAGYGYALARGF